ncbi:MAG: phage tail protein [Dehalococcoidales bacterium]
MKSSKVYLVGGSICLALVIVVLLFAAAYVVPALMPALQPERAQAAETGTREDPLIGFNVGLEIEGKLVGFFTECSGVGSESWVIEHKLVDKLGNVIVQKVPGQLKWTDIVLKRGITSNMSMWDWRRQVEEGKIGEARANGSIVMYNQAMEEIARWNFKNGWPRSITGPTVEADSNDFAVEAVEITHEGLTRIR